MNVYCDPVCTVDDVCSVDVLRILTLGYDRGFLSTSRSSMVSVQNYLCKENRFRVRIFGLHLAQIGQLYNLYNIVQTPLIDHLITAEIDMMISNTASKEQRQKKTFHTLKILRIQYF